MQIIYSILAASPGGPDIGASVHVRILCEPTVTNCIIYSIHKHAIIHNTRLPIFMSSRDSSNIHEAECTALHTAYGQTNTGTISLVTGSTPLLPQKL